MADSDKELDDIFSDDKATETVTETQEQPAVEAKPDGEPEGEADTEKGDKEPDPEKNSDAEPPSAEAGLQAGLLAERRRRQEAERELSRLKKEQTPVPDPIEEPEEHARYVNAQSVEGRIAGSRATVLAFKDDYEEMERVFLGLVQDEKGNIKDQTLVERMNNADSPAMFVYTHAQNHLEADKFSTPEKRAAFEKEMEERVEARVTERLLAAQGGEQPSKSAPNVPSLTQATATASNSEPVAKVETIEEMFKDSPF